MYCISSFSTLTSVGYLQAKDKNLKNLKRKPERLLLFKKGKSYPSRCTQTQTCAGSIRKRYPNKVIRDINELEAKYSNKIKT